MAKKRKPEENQEAIDQEVADSAESTTEAAEPADPQAALQQELDAAKAAAAQNWDLYLRERAELENFRKRTQRDKEEAIRFANDRLLRELIPVLDNLERAVEHAGHASGSQGLVDGVTMTISLFNKVLGDFGVKPINAVGQPFDPNHHQAMGQVETAEHPPNAVVTEFQKGYLLNDRLLRPSLVMVAKAPAAKADGSPAADA